MGRTREIILRQAFGGAERSREKKNAEGHQLSFVNDYIEQRGREGTLTCTRKTDPALGSVEGSVKLLLIKTHKCSFRHRASALKNPFELADISDISMSLPPKRVVNKYFFEYVSVGPLNQSVSCHCFLTASLLLASRVSPPKVITLMN